MCIKYRATSTETLTLNCRNLNLLHYSPVFKFLFSIIYSSQSEYYQHNLPNPNVHPRWHPSNTCAVSTTFLHPSTIFHDLHCNKECFSWWPSAQQHTVYSSSSLPLLLVEFTSQDLMQVTYNLCTSTPQSKCMDGLIFLDGLILVSSWDAMDWYINSDYQGNMDMEKTLMTHWSSPG